MNVCKRIVIITAIRITIIFTIVIRWPAGSLSQPANQSDRR